jgi:hypothetical protein
LPLGPQRGAVDFLSAKKNFVDPPRVADFFQGIRVEDDEIGALARRN